MEHKDFDIVVLGAGGAGVAAAVAAARLGARVAVVAKEPVGYGNTRVALGALAHGRLADSDSAQLFYDDMLRGGEGLNDSRLAQVIAAEAPESVRLLETYGHVFRRDSEGRLSAGAATRSGGHSVARTVRSPSMGIGIGQALRAATARAGVTVVEGVVVGELLTDDRKVRGLIGLQVETGEIVVLSARAVILATGGAGWLYFPHTSCMRAATGDGYALALAAGAQLMDMEQVQFIPFGVSFPAAYVGLYLGEPSLAGPSGRLLNRDGEVVLTGMAPLTRAQVVRAMAEEIEKGNGTGFSGLLLDLSPNFAGPRGEELRQRVMAGETADLVKAAYGLKAWRCEEPWDVSPSVHFNMGGVVTDEWGKTSVDGLYAVGEVAGGVHGGNRLGSVALTEIFVMGRRAGEHAAAAVKTGDAVALPPELVAAGEGLFQRLRGAKGEHRPISLIRRLQSVMWEKVGIARSESRCREALAAIDSLDAATESLMVSSSSRYNAELIDAVELRHMLKAARAITLAALERRESRGAHFRTDFPGRDELLGKNNTLVRTEDLRLHVGLRPVA